MSVAIEMSMRNAYAVILLVFVVSHTRICFHSHIRPLRFEICLMWCDALNHTYATALTWTTYRVNRECDRMRCYASVRGSALSPLQVIIYIKCTKAYCMEWHFEDQQCDEFEIVSNFVRNWINYWTFIFKHHFFKYPRFWFCFVFF